MIKINFSKEEREALHYQRYHHPHPHVQKKMEVLWLKSFNYPHFEIMKIAQISKATLCGYLKDYQEGGIEKLFKFKFHHPVRSLNKHVKTIEEYAKKTSTNFCQRGHGKNFRINGYKT